MHGNERVRAEPELVDLVELIGGAVRFLPRLLGHDTTVATDLAPGLAPVKVDRQMFEHAMLNLFTNARDAMPDGGLLTIRTKSAEVRAGDARYPDLPAGQYVSLAVADTGCGMTDEVKARIFEPFFTTKGPGRGNGLGLAIVCGIVRSHGGAVAVESAVGVGTTFELLFPPGDDADTPIVVTG